MPPAFRLGRGQSRCPTIPVAAGRIRSIPSGSAVPRPVDFTVLSTRDPSPQLTFIVTWAGDTRLTGRLLLCSRFQIRVSSRPRCQSRGANMPGRGGRAGSGFTWPAGQKRCMGRTHSEMVRHLGFSFGSPPPLIRAATRPAPSCRPISSGFRTSSAPAAAPSTGSRWAMAARCRTWCWGWSTGREGCGTAASAWRLTLPRLVSLPRVGRSRPKS